MQYRDGILCKLVADRFVPVLPRQSDIISAILRDFHNSGLGGHLGSKKLHKIVCKRFFGVGMK